MTKIEITFWSVSLAYLVSSIIFFLLLRRETKTTDYWIDRWVKAEYTIKKLQSIIKEMEDQEIGTDDIVPEEDWKLEGEEWKDV